MEKWVEQTVQFFSKNPTSAKEDKHHMFSLICRIYSLKMSNRSVKQFLFGGRYQWKREGEKRRKAGEWIWSKYFILMYENISMKPVEIVLRRRGNKRDREVNLIEV
jgi:hypothetical protein